MLRLELGLEWCNRLVYVADLLLSFLRLTPDFLYQVFLSRVLKVDSHNNN